MLVFHPLKDPRDQRELTGTATPCHVESTLPHNTRQGKENALLAWQSKHHVLFRMLLTRRHELLSHSRVEERCGPSPCRLPPHVGLRRRCCWLVRMMRPDHRCDPTRLDPHLTRPDPTRSDLRPNPNMTRRDATRPDTSRHPPRSTDRLTNPPEHVGPADRSGRPSDTVRPTGRPTEQDRPTD